MVRVNQYQVEQSQLQANVDFMTTLSHTSRRLHYTRTRNQFPDLITGSLDLPLNHIHLVMPDRQRPYPIMGVSRVR